MRQRVLGALALLGGFAGGAVAGELPPVKVGGRIFTEFGVQTSDSGRLKALGGAGFSSFSVTRAWLTVEGRPTDWLSAYMELDATHMLELSGSTEKWAAAPGRMFPYLRTAQIELRDVLEPYLRLRMGLLPTPWTQFENGLYGYRMQNVQLSVREKVLAPRDFGVAAYGDLPAGLGSYHVGLFNGSGLAPETSAGKLAAARLTFTPFACWEPIAPLGVSGMGATSPEKFSWGGLLHYGRQGVTPLTVAVGPFGFQDPAKGGGAWGWTGFGVLALGTFHPWLEPIELVGRLDGWDPDTRVAGDAYTQVVGGIAYKITPQTRLLVDSESRLHEDAQKGLHHMLFVHVSTAF